MIISICVHRGHPVGGQDAPQLHLTTPQVMPDDLSKDWQQKNEEIFQRDAELLEDALRRVLPGGTYDRLLVEIFKRKASQLIVVRQ